MALRESNRVRTGVIAAAATGQNLVLSVPAGQRAIILSYVIVAAGAVTAQWESGTTDLSGVMALAANGGISIAGSREDPVMKTVAPGDDLFLTLGAVFSVAGHFSYILVEAVS